MKKTKWLLSVVILFAASMFFYTCSSNPKEIGSGQNSSILPEDVVEKQDVVKKQEPVVPKELTKEEQYKILVDRKRKIGLYDSGFGMWFQIKERAVNRKIFKAVAHLIDTTDIHHVYHYDDHYLLHMFNVNDPSDLNKIGTLYINKGIDKFNLVTVGNANPFDTEYPIASYKQGIPVYDVRDKSRKEIESSISNILWDNNQGTPTHIYTQYDCSDFEAENMALSYNFLVMGTRGSMAAQSKIIIRDKNGFPIDTISRVGKEMWNPCMTDDGRYLAYLYGRELPESCGGVTTQNFIIYDIEKKEHIYEYENFSFSSSVMTGAFNFFQFSTKIGTENYFVLCTPHKKQFYVGNRSQYPSGKILKWGDKGFELEQNKEKVIIPWERNHQIISFKNYNQKTNYEK